MAGAAWGRPARQLCPTGDRTLSCVCQDTLDGDNWGRATGLMGRGSGVLHTLQSTGGPTGTNVHSAEVKRPGLADWRVPLHGGGSRETHTQPTGGVGAWQLPGAGADPCCLLPMTPARPSTRHRYTTLLSPQRTPVLAPISESRCPINPAPSPGLAGTHCVPQRSPGQEIRALTLAGSLHR